MISTLKRPVPLEHYLYTGTDGKSKDEIFLLQDASGKFLETGHRKAEMAKKARERKNKQVSIVTTYVFTFLIQNTKYL